MIRRMEELDHILAEATSAIEADYFRLPIDGGIPVFRERVYCYELYHQMRSRWPPRSQCRYLLNGEVDTPSAFRAASLRALICASLGNVGTFVT